MHSGIELGLGVRKASHSHISHSLHSKNSIACIEALYIPFLRLVPYVDFIAYRKSCLRWRFHGVCGDNHAAVIAVYTRQGDIYILSLGMIRVEEVRLFFCARVTFIMAGK